MKRNKQKQRNKALQIINNNAKKEYIQMLLFLLKMINSTNTDKNNKYQQNMEREYL